MEFGALDHQILDQCTTDHLGRRLSFDTSGRQSAESEPDLPSTETHKLVRSNSAGCSDRENYLRDRDANRARIRELLTSKGEFGTSRNLLQNLFKSYSVDGSDGQRINLLEGSELTLPALVTKYENAESEEQSIWTDISNSTRRNTISNPETLNAGHKNAVMTAASINISALKSGNTMATGKGVSRLGMMQARLQEQLMVEKESRLLEMAARQEAERDSTIQRVTKSSASSLSSSLSSLSLGNTMSGQGRVRKLFEDRRSMGYDKSYPLNPVKGGSSGPKVPARGVVRSGGNNLNHRGNTSDKPSGGYGGSYGQMRSRSQVTPQRTAVKTAPTRNINNNHRLNHHKSNPSLLEAENNQLNPRSNNNSARRPANGLSRGVSPGVKNSSTTPTPRKPLPVKKPSPAPLKSKPSPSPTPRSKAPPPFKSSTLNTKNKTPASLSPSPLVRKGSMNSTPASPRVCPPGMSQCSICDRCFNPDRIDKHVEICKKSQQKAKKRKVFDPVKMRNKGTEAEKYIARGTHLKEIKKPKKKDWRKQHEDFIATVRAAKGIKGYEAPPMDTSDYIQCPHCGRKFNQVAAERHIPKCSDIQSNKPRKR